MENITRRDFASGMAATAGAAALAAGVALAPDTVSVANATEAPASTPDWLGPEPSRTPDDCTETLTCDVLVIGAGVSGSMAAFGAIQGGAKPLIIDKHTTFHFGGNGASFINSRHQLEAGLPEYDPFELLYKQFNESQSRADMALLADWAFQSGAICDELIEKVADPYGVPYVYKTEDSFDQAYELQANYMTGVVFGDLNVDNYKPFITGLHRYIEDNGGEFRYQVRAEKLVQDETGRVTGVICSDADGNLVLVEAPKGVIVCTGSYGHDQKMLQAFCSPMVQRLFTESNIYNSYFDAEDLPDDFLDTGDGHRMLCWAGAAMEEGTHGYCGWPLMGALGSPYLAVNQNGERFMNETVYMLNALPTVIEQPCEKGVYTWQIMSNEDVAVPNIAGVPAEILQMFIDTGETYEANTIEELAELMEVDPEVFGATVNRYNELCAAGFDEDYAKRADYLVPVQTPPFKATRVRYGVAVTLGGVKCNAKLQVLDAGGNVIPGAYAVGNTVGRRFGWAYQNRHNGMTNSLAIVHGYIAGKTCAEA